MQQIHDHSKPHALKGYILQMLSLSSKKIPLSLKVTERSRNWNSATQIIMWHVPAQKQDK